MTILLKLEDAAKFLAAYWLSLYLGHAWWIFFAWLLAPDLSAIGYVVNTRVGALQYCTSPGACFGYSHCRSLFIRSRFNLRRNSPVWSQCDGSSVGIRIEISRRF